MSYAGTASVHVSQSQGGRERIPNLIKSQSQVKYGDNKNQGLHPNATTYKTDYEVPKVNKQDLFFKTFGPKEESGCTHNIKTEDTLSGWPLSVYKPSFYRRKTNRPTGKTQYTDEYLTYEKHNGKEPLPNCLAENLGRQKNCYFIQNKLWPDYAQRNFDKVYDTAENMSKEKLNNLMKTNPAEYYNVIHASQEPSMERGVYQGVRTVPPSTASRIGNASVGPIEPSGFTTNMGGYVESAETGPGDQLTTHYMTRYYKPPPHRCENDSEGHVHFNIQPGLRNAISREAAISQFEAQVPATDKKHLLDSYQARSVRVRENLPTVPNKDW